MIRCDVEGCENDPEHLVDLAINMAGSAYANPVGATVPARLCEAHRWQMASEALARFGLAAEPVTHPEAGVKRGLGLSPERGAATADAESPCAPASAATQITWPGNVTWTDEMPATPPIEVESLTVRIGSTGLVDDDSQTGDKVRTMPDVTLDHKPGGRWSEKDLDTVQAYVDKFGTAAAAAQFAMPLGTIYWVVARADEVLGKDHAPTQRWDTEPTEPADSPTVGPSFRCSYCRQLLPIDLTGTTDAMQTIAIQKARHTWDCDAAPIEARRYVGALLDAYDPLVHGTRIEGPGRT